MAGLDEQCYSRVALISNLLKNKEKIYGQQTQPRQNEAKAPGCAWF